jgi:ABC-type glycerol-3-phosphate transport system permease component
MASESTVATQETEPVANERTRRAQWPGFSARRTLPKLILSLFAFVLAASFFLPFAWLLSSSLKTEQQIFATTPIWIPSPLQWSNYVEALTAARFDLFFRNTIFLAVVTSFGVALSSALVAYGFSRIEWPGRDAIFFVLLMTMMVPYQVTMVPVYIVFSKLGWVGSYLPLTVPYFFGSTFFIFLLRQFFRSIPMELTDAARIDGCSELGIMMRIILPLSRPAIAVVVLFNVLGIWGDFLEPLIYINKVKMYTLSLGLLHFQGMHFTQWELLMAASAAITIPVVIVFFFTQRTFIESITFTGLKDA